MHTQASESIQRTFDELEQELRTLSHKHNALVISIGLMWQAIRQSCMDKATKQLCEQSLEDLNTLLYQYEIDPEIPPSGKTAWD